MSDEKKEEKIIVNDKEVTKEEFASIQEEANKGKVRLKQVDESGNEFKKLDKMNG